MRPSTRSATSHDASLGRREVHRVGTGQDAGSRSRGRGRGRHLGSGTHGGRYDAVRHDDESALIGGPPRRRNVVFHVKRAFRGAVSPAVDR